MEAYFVGIWVMVCAAILPFLVRKPIVVFITAALLGAGVVWILFERKYLSGDSVAGYLISFFIGSMGASLAAAVYGKRRSS